MENIFNPFLFACILFSSMNMQSRFQNLTKTIDGSEVVQMSTYKHKEKRKNENLDINDMLPFFL